MCKKLISVGVLAMVAFNGAMAAEQRIPFPVEYATKMINYVSLDRTQNGDQTIRLFAPKAALDAAKAGKELPYGTVLVAEIYKAKKDENDDREAAHA